MTAQLPIVYTPEDVASHLGVSERTLRSEMKQLIAMIYRLWAEGDQVHGLPSVHGATLAEAAATPQPGDEA